MNLIAGQYGHLSVISLNSKRNRHNYWNCICDCGNKETIVIRSSELISGRRTDCKKCAEFLRIRLLDHAVNWTPPEEKIIVKPDFKNMEKIYPVTEWPDLTVDTGDDPKAPETNPTTNNNTIDPSDIKKSLDDEESVLEGAIDSIITQHRERAVRHIAAILKEVTKKIGPT